MHIVVRLCVWCVVVWFSVWLMCVVECAVGAWLVCGWVWLSLWLFVWLCTGDVAIVCVVCGVIIALIRQVRGYKVYTCLTRQRTRLYQFVLVLCIENILTHI